MSNNNNEIVVSNRYSEAAIKFRMAWAEYMNHEERVKCEVVNLVKILENDGMTRTQAIQKIVNDHKDLEGFSQKTIYRKLPEDMKQDNSRRELKSLQEEAVPNKPSQLSHDRSKGINKITESQALKDFRDIKGTITQQSAAAISKTIEEEEEEEEEEVTYDSKFVNALIAENEQLKIENFRLKKDYQELETKYNEVIEPYQIKDSIIVNDQEIPLIITVDPFRRTITVEVDQK